MEGRARRFRGEPSGVARVQVWSTVFLGRHLATIALGLVAILLPQIGPRHVWLGAAILGLILPYGVVLHLVYRRTGRPPVVMAFIDPLLAPATAFAIPGMFMSALLGGFALLALLAVHFPRKVLSASTVITIVAFFAAAASRGQVYDQVLGLAGIAVLAPLVVYALGELFALERSTEQSLVASEARYRDLFDNASDIFYTHDLSGTITSANAAASRLAGVPVERLVGRNIDDLLAPDSVDVARRMIVAKLQGRPRTTYEVEVGDDGHRRILELSTRIVYEHGEPAGVQGIGRDVTQRRRAENDLWQSGERFRTLALAVAEIAAAETAEDVMRICLKVSSDLLACELAALLEFRDQAVRVVETLGWPDWLKGYVYPSRKGFVEQAITSGRPVMMNTSQEVADAHPVAKDIGAEAMLCIPLPDSAPFRGAFVMIRKTPDAPYLPIDEQVGEAIGGHVAAALHKAVLLEKERGLRDELERAQRVRDDFLTAVSHELRTPLTTMYGFIETLHTRGAELTPAMRDDLLRRAGQQANRLRRLIEGVLDLSQSPAIAPDIHGVDLQSVVESAAAAASTPCVIDVPEITVLADPDYLEIALRNLLENASRYAPGGETRIGATVNGSRVLITVDDSGPGIGERDRLNLFDRFYRGTSAQEFPGLGVGLALVREFTEAMHGEVWHEPRDPRGSRFVLALPQAVLASS